MPVPARPGGNDDPDRSFTVDSFEPRQVTGLEAEWFGLMTFAKTFTARITGHATTVFMSAGTEEGSRSYVATERITGRTGDGREGSVTVQQAVWSPIPVRGSGTWCRARGRAALPAGLGPPGSSTMIRARTSRATWRERPGSAR